MSMPLSSFPSLEALSLEVTSLGEQWGEACRRGCVAIYVETTTLANGAGMQFFHLMPLFDEPWSFLCCFSL